MLAPQLHLKSTLWLGVKTFGKPVRYLGSNGHALKMTFSMGYLGFAASDDQRVEALAGREGDGEWFHYAA